MRVLIVQSAQGLRTLWQRHLERSGMTVITVGCQNTAIEEISRVAPDIIILDLVLNEGSALAVADYANYRCPDAQVIFVTNANFFSDGSIFSLATNARALVQRATPPEDLAAMVAHYGGH